MTPQLVQLRYTSQAWLTAEVKGIVGSYGYIMLNSKPCVVFRMPDGSWQESMFKYEWLEVYTKRKAQGE